MDPALAAILFAAGRKVESFPADFAAALLSGKVGYFAIPVIAIHAGTVPVPHAPPPLPFPIRLFVIYEISCAGHCRGLEEVP